MVGLGIHRNAASGATCGHLKLVGSYLLVSAILLCRVGCIIGTVVLLSDVSIAISQTIDNMCLDNSHNVKYG